MSFLSTKLAHDEEDEDKVSVQESDTSRNIGVMRKFSIASSDSRMSAFSSPSRKFSMVANNVSRCRKTSRSMSIYVSPYCQKQVHDKTDKNIEDSETQIYENTYRMEPKQIIPLQEIRQIISKTLQNAVGDELYKHMNPGRVCKTLSQLIKDQVKSLSIDRYKVVALVTMGSTSQGGTRIASRCLWDAQFDRFVSATVENGSLFVVGTVYMVYLE